jgi:hypothetical protein
MSQEIWPVPEVIRDTQTRMAERVELKGGIRCTQIVFAGHPRLPPVSHHVDARKMVREVCQLLLVAGAGALCYTTRYVVIT